MQDWNNMNRIHWRSIAINMMKKILGSHRCVFSFIIHCLNNLHRFYNVYLSSYDNESVWMVNRLGSMWGYCMTHQVRRSDHYGSQNVSPNQTLIEMTKSLSVSTPQARQRYTSKHKYNIHNKYKWCSNIHKHKQINTHTHTHTHSNLCHKCKNALVLVDVWVGGGGRFF